MALPLRNWTVSINNAYSTTNSHTVQYQQSLYELKVTFTLAGWTVQLSSNTTVAGASDTWNSRNDVVPGAAGSGSWIVLQSPAAFSAQTIQLLLYTSDASAPYQTIAARFTPGTYSGGSTTTLPASSGFATSETSATSRTLLQWTTYTEARWARWYTDRGDVMFGVKLQGNPGFNWFFMLTSNGGPNDNHATSGHGTGDYRMFLVMTSTGAGSNALDRSFWSATTTRVLVPAGTSETAVGRFTAPWLDVNGYDNALDQYGRVTLSMPEVWQSIGASGRSLGTIVDMHACPQDGYVGTVIDGEDGQTLRRVCVGDWFMYMPTASLPLE